MTDHLVFQKLPVLPLRDIVVFPHMVVPLFVGREKSVQALEKVMSSDQKQILLLTQKNAAQDSPKKTDLYQTGTLATVLQLLKLPDGTVKVLVEGSARAEVIEFSDGPDFFEAYAQEVAEKKYPEEELEALMRTIISEFEQYIKLNKKIPPDVLITINQIISPEKLADTVASYFSLKIAQKQELLEIYDIKERLEKVLNFIESESSILKVEKRIRGRVKKQMEKTQRDYYLSEQLKAIHKELGEGEGVDEVGQYEKKIKKAKLTKEAEEKAQGELKKLKMMNSQSAEAGVVRNYLDWLLDIPWKKPTKIKKDLEKAQKVLDKEHYALEKVKERILEYLAVQNRVGKVRSQILCLVGPPGVGKTSLGESIARATGRNFARISLGGVRDESEIRGHRRTYIGAMPGKIIQGMKKAKASNPLFLLDEIDKMGSDFRGDPAAALLEVLDPSQNGTFNDHYLEVDYDLSDVMFITTANTLNMPQPLLDRMEIIRLSGYTEDEKVAIAQTHLIPKQMEFHGLKGKEICISKDVVCDLVRYYTREAGVRSLEREIAKICRKSVKQLSKKDVKTVKVTSKNLEDFCGVRRYTYGSSEKRDYVGTVTGLAWTEVGGDILSIEAVAMPGKGKITITGKLGDVMQESIQAALSYVRSRSQDFGIDKKIFEETDIHIHVPEGATPKDGPSAGIGMMTSIVSMLTGVPVSKSVAMTGEITLRGHVLAIGGLKEKLLAALRGGIKKVLIPKDNVKDLKEIPDNIKEGLEIIPVEYADQVLKHALTKELLPLIDITNGAVGKATSSEKSEDPIQCVPVN